MNILDQVLKAAPEVMLFASLALGHLVGRIKFGSFSLGGVAGSLIVALVVGQLTGVVMPEAVKAVCFALFIYAVGFRSGPEFFGGLNRSSLKLVLSSVLHCIAALIMVLVIARVCGFSKGYAAGIGAGALTQTAMLGTAGDAVSRLGLTPEELTKTNTQMAVGFAITYIFGTIGVIVFLGNFAPRWLGVDVKQAACELESQLAGSEPGSRSGLITPYVPLVARAFRVGPAAGRTVGEMTRQFGRASIERVLRRESVIEPSPGAVLQAGDVVGVAGLEESVLGAGQLLGPELESREALSFPMKTLTVILTGKRVVGHTLGQIRTLLGDDHMQGVYLSTLKRQGLPVPILGGTVVQRGDIAELVGQPDQVERVAKTLGVAEAEATKTDLPYHALGIVLGTLVGLCSINVGSIPVTLGVGGGVLMVGLCFGWLHARFPVFGGMPAPAQWILSELGLSAFAASVGLAAGPRAVAAIREEGVVLLLAGAVLTLVPLIVALLFGRFVLKLHPVILLGALCGGQTVAAALNAVNEKTESMTPVLGFTVTYAVSNVLLAVWGPVIVAMT
jgi:aspartate-alanine antiporter